jgi:hypothetical protein
MGRRRMWAAGGWSPFIVQASKVFVPGEPVQWSDLDTFKVVLPKPCQGLAFQDGALLAFAETDIYAISTDGGPGNDGLAAFADPRLFCPGLGVKDSASILETPIGVIFRSRRGFELIPRGLGGVQPLPGVETQLETYTTIISSTLHVDGRTTTAQFVARAGAAGQATVVLVFDLDKQAWSVDTYPIDPRNIGTTSDGRLLLASDDTSVSPAFLVEDAANFDDNGTFFQARLRFHDVYPFGPFMMGAVHTCLGRMSAEGITIVNISLGVDGGSARTVTWTFSGATAHETYRECTPAVDQCRGTSVQLETYDTTSVLIANYGVKWYGFALCVQAKDHRVITETTERA